MKLAPLIAAFFLLPTGDFSAGVDAYRGGDYRESLSSFARAELDAGSGASWELLFNQTLAALRAGELRRAEAAAEKLAVRGGKEREPIRDFLLGCSSFTRCEWAEAEASMTDADPTSLDRAVGHARSAFRSWQLAAMSRDDWPEARRNVMRALLKLEELKKKKEEASSKRRKEKKEEKKIPPPDEKKDDKTEKKPEEEKKPKPPAMEPMARELSRDRVKLLFDRLKEKEQEKLKLRQTERRASKGKVEKDW